MLQGVGVGGLYPEDERVCAVREGNMLHRAVVTEACAEQGVQSGGCPLCSKGL